MASFLQTLSKRDIIPYRRKNVNKTIHISLFGNFPYHVHSYLPFYERCTPFAAFIPILTLICHPRMLQKYHPRTPQKCHPRMPLAGIHRLVRTQQNKLTKQQRRAQPVAPFHETKGVTKKVRRTNGG
jgi:hypothetical protein